MIFGGILELKYSFRTSLRIDLVLQKSWMSALLYSIDCESFSYVWCTIWQSQCKLVLFAPGLFRYGFSAICNFSNWANILLTHMTLIYTRRGGASWSNLPICSEVPLESQKAILPWREIRWNDILSQSQTKVFQTIRRPSVSSNKILRPPRDL